MRYINQRDYPDMLYVTRADPENPRHERGKTTTIKTSGCGLCAAIMVADRLLPAYEFELEDAAQKWIFRAEVSDSRNMIPPTGDQENLVRYGIGLALSVLLAAGIAVYLKRNRGDL